MLVRSQRRGCFVTCFCYQVITKAGNKTATPPWPDPHSLPHLVVVWYVKFHHFIWYNPFNLFHNTHKRHHSSPKKASFVVSFVTSEANLGPTFPLRCYMRYHAIFIWPCYYDSVPHSFQGHKGLSTICWKIQHNHYIHHFIWYHLFRENELEIMNNQRGFDHIYVYDNVCIIILTFSIDVVSTLSKCMHHMIV